MSSSNHSQRERSGLRSSVSLFPPILLLLLVALLATGCTAGLPLGEPSLPPGFLEASVPDVELQGYVYVNQGRPMQVPSLTFMRRSDMPSGLAQAVEITSVALWVGPTVAQTGVHIQFSDAETASLVTQGLERRGSANLWQRLQGASLYITRGTGSWVEELRQAIEGGRFLPFTEAYPEAWGLMSRLPPSPPQPPLAVSFVNVEEALVDSVTRKAGQETQIIGQALDAARVSTVALGFYGGQDFTWPDADVRPAFLRQQGVSAVAVTRSSYPGFILNLFFGSFASRAGMEEVRLESGEEVLARRLDDELHVLVKNKGSFLVGAASSDREQAEGLLQSLLSAR